MTILTESTEYSASTESTPPAGTLRNPGQDAPQSGFTPPDGPDTNLRAENGSRGKGTRLRPRVAPAANPPKSPAPEAPRWTRPELHILADTREQSPWTFPPDLLLAGKTWGIAVERTTLPTGDYSLAGHSGRAGEPAGIVVERKASLDELAGNLTAGRECFERELDRMRAYETALIVVESGGWDDLRRWRYQSSMTPASFEASLHAVQERWRVPIVFAGGSHAAMIHAANAFRRFMERLLRMAGPPSRASP